MQAKLLAALAMGNLAMGMTSSVKYMNTTAATTSMKSTTSMSKTMTATSTSAVASDPATAPGGFVAVGCIQSTDGFSGFFLTVSSASNSINFCAASCSSNQYFGVSGDDCYCGTSLSLSSSTKVSSSQCDTPCPGNPNDSCGGVLSTSSRRRAIAANILLNVYKKAVTTTTTGVTTYTSTYTSTTTGTITSCPPYVTNCPVGKATTVVKTMTATWCPEMDEDWSSSSVVCYGNWCVSKCSSPGCVHNRVICQSGSCHTEPCMNGETWNQLIICDDSTCNFANYTPEQCAQEKVVCYGGNCAKETCVANECQKKMVCTGDSCNYQSCSGSDCYMKEVWSGSTCTTEAPCSGASCPTPAPCSTSVVCEECEATGTGAVSTATSIPSPVVAGSSKAAPIFGITLFGAVAGFAFLL